MLGPKKESVSIPLVSLPVDDEKRSITETLSCPKANEIVDLGFLIQNFGRRGLPERKDTRSLLGKTVHRGVSLSAPALHGHAFPPLPL